MSNNVCVIGGSRYFGRHLLGLLRDAGHRVTVVNRGSTPPPPGVEQLVADRDNEPELAAALGARTFDVVVDQVCYHPVQAATALRVFRGRTARYVLTSSMEVYNPVTSQALPPQGPERPFTEEAVDPARWPVRMELPWSEYDFAAAGAGDTRYAEGKRQAEAVFAQDGGLPYAAVRCAHVLGGGSADFTGRLDHYTRRIAGAEAILVHPEVFPTAFIEYREIADFLLWAARSDFTGPVNACSHGRLDARELSGLIASAAGVEPSFLTVDPASGDDASPFSFDHYYGMSNARAERLGFAFSHTSDWLPGAITESLASRAAA
ncbi:NAD-dependent epimerase/dehydratase family protein [Streptomyces sp. NPDC088846]|uniref:NAD-dependent epimerase/dehydratase family protein n=1 Tax=Streptomyces sp. NPDC088846 TaxID=3365908 RepID=UPI0038282DF3